MNTKALDWLIEAAIEELYFARQRVATPPRLLKDCEKHGWLTPDDVQARMHTKFALEAVQQARALLKDS